MDAFGRKPELLGDELRISGLVALPGRLGTDQDRDVAVGLEPDVGGFLAHRAANLHIGGKPDAAHQTLLPRRLGAPGKFLPVRNFHRPLHMRGEVARIVDLPSSCFVRHRPRRDKILAPDRIRRHPELARRCIDEALDHVGGIRTPRAAIGINWHGVGEDRADAAMERLDIVKAGQHSGAAVRNVGPEGRQIGAHVAHQIDVHREKLAILGERHPRRGDVIAPLRVAHEVIGAVGGPLDALAQLARGNRDKRVFAIGKQLGAEPTADIRADHPHLFERDLQDHPAKNFAQPMAALAADRQRQMVAFGVVLAYYRACFHEVGDDARIDD